MREDTRVRRAGRRARRRRGPLEIEEQRAKGAFASVGGRELKLSNLDKVLYPETGFTKAQLIDYYAAVAPVLLPHLAGRPLTVTRWPDGVEAKSFFQKQSPAHRPEWVRTATVASERASRSTTRWPRTCRRSSGWPTWPRSSCTRRWPAPRRWTARRRVVFDLDPGEPASVIECCRVALRLHSMFEHLGLQSFVKTSGSKGLQLYLPLNDPQVELRADQALRQGGRRAARERGTRPRRLADDEGPARRQGADRLEPERRKEDDSLRLLAAGPAPAHRLDTARRGRRSRRPSTVATRRHSPSRPRRCSSASPSAVTCWPRCSRSSSGCRASELTGTRARPVAPASRRAGRRRPCR